MHPSSRASRLKRKEHQIVTLWLTCVSQMMKAGERGMLGCGLLLCMCDGGDLFFSVHDSPTLSLHKTETP
jgi:hypothetical protein